MIRPINRDQFILQQLSIPATRRDRKIAQDLRDTLLFHREECVGMAANMIGEYKNIIGLFIGTLPVVMYNPTIIKKSHPYQVKEGCLSLDGQRQTTRFEKINVEFFDDGFRRHRQEFTGTTAQIIQHEIDHCLGKLI